MAKFCDQCGSPLNDGAKFCQECGKMVTLLTKKTVNELKKENAKTISNDPDNIVCEATQKADNSPQKTLVSHVEMADKSDVKVKTKKKKFILLILYVSLLS